MKGIPKFLNLNIQNIERVANLLKWALCKHFVSNKYLYKEFMIGNICHLWKKGQCLKICFWTGQKGITIWIISLSLIFFKFIVPTMRQQFWAVQNLCLTWVLTQYTTFEFLFLLYILKGRRLESLRKFSKKTPWFVESDRHTSFGGPWVFLCTYFSLGIGKHNVS